MPLGNCHGPTYNVALNALTDAATLLRGPSSIVSAWRHQALAPLYKSRAGSSSWRVERGA